MRKESSAEATKGAPVPPIGGTDCAANTLQEREGRDAFGSGIDRMAWVNKWSDLASDEGGDGGRRGEVAHGGRARGEMGGGTREQCGSNKRCTGSLFWAPLTT